MREALNRTRIRVKTIESVDLTAKTVNHHAPERPPRADHPLNQVWSWDITDHRHAGLGLLSSEVVHYGQAQAAYDARAQMLAAAHAAHPERLVRQPPRPPQLSTAAWINPPKSTDSEGVPQ